jgi:hypothetical protein
MKNGENVGLTNREREETFQEMMVAIRGSQSDLASSNDGEDGDAEDDQETELGKLSEDDDASWAMGTISSMVQHHFETFRQKRMKLDKLTQPGWEDAADNFIEKDNNYGTSELMIPATIQPHIDDGAVAAAPRTLAELMGCLDIISGTV